MCKAWWEHNPSTNIAAQTVYYVLCNFLRMQGKKKCSFILRALKSMVEEQSVLECGRGRGREESQDRRRV